MTTMNPTQVSIKNLPSIAGYREIMHQRQERNYPHMIFKDRRGVPINFNPFSMRVTDDLLMYGPRKSAFLSSAFLK